MAPSPDLNQLRAFVEIYETGSVTAAARRLHVTQPTVSYTLGRLRRRFGDELFRRGRSGLEPTPAATRLYGPLRRAVADIDAVVATAETFDPARSRDRFALALSDLGELSFLPPILDTLEREAPGVGVVARPLVVAQAAEWLLGGEVDLVVTSADVGGGRLDRYPFLAVGYVVIAAADHPRLSGRRLTPRRFARERHVHVVGTAGHTGPTTMLRAHGLEREVALEVATFSALPYVVQATDLLGMVPRHIAGIMADHHAIAVHELPWPVPPIEVSTLTRHAPALGPAQRWFVTVVRRVLDAVAADAGVGVRHSSRSRAEDRAKDHAQVAGS